MLMLYKTPSYRISLLDVKLIKLPTYESADEPEDLEASAAIVAAAALVVEREIEQRTPNTCLGGKDSNLVLLEERKGNIGFLWSEDGDVGFPPIYIYKIKYEPFFIRSGLRIYKGVSNISSNKSRNK